MRQRIGSYLIGLNQVYLGSLVTWATMRMLFGDRWWWLFFLNTFAQYLFLPLPALFATAWFTRRRSLWAGFGTALTIGTHLYGWMWWPKPNLHHESHATLTVMTFNMLGFNQHPDGVVAAIRASTADVIAIQELNVPTARHIQKNLANLYPYQALNPYDGVSGMGVISRYPLDPIDVTLPGDWIGQPQVLSLHLDSSTLTLIHFHTRSTDISSPDRMATVRERERQAQVLAAFASKRPEPLIALGDFNATSTSVAYRTMSNMLIDSWLEAGWGLGNTFPGAASPGSSRPRIAGILVPPWLLRIDYIFHSHQLQALGAWIGPWDEVSDHRSVVVRLALITSVRVKQSSEAATP
jgi:vancomycin resistance protein VanJ